MTPTKKEARPALVTRQPGESRKNNPVYPASVELQEAGELSADLLADLADRFLSALFHAIREGVNPAGDDRYELPVAAMPTREHEAVLRALIAYVELRQHPSVGALRTVAGQLGYAATEKTLNPYNADLIDRLASVEISPAGLHNYARLLLHSYRRRVQARRLWKALADRVSDPLGDGMGRIQLRTVAAPAPRRFSPRAVARVLGRESA